MLHQNKACCWKLCEDNIDGFECDMQEAVRAVVAEILKSLQALLPSAVIYPALASLARKGES